MRVGKTRAKAEYFEITFLFQLSFFLQKLAAPLLTQHSFKFWEEKNIYSSGCVDDSLLRWDNAFFVHCVVKADKGSIGLIQYVCNLLSKLEKFNRLRERERLHSKACHCLPINI